MYDKAKTEVKQTSRLNSVQMYRQYCFKF